jgi:protein-L-isoaspartate O-methyltransferase
MEDDPRRHDLRAVFNRAAEDYQRSRPVLPPGLFDDLVYLAGLRPGDRVIEIGSGTGQATVPLAERGLAVTAVELGAELAAVARRRVAGFPAVEVVTQALGEPRRTEFLTRVRHRLESLSLSHLTATFVGHLTIGRRD